MIRLMANVSLFVAVLCSAVVTVGGSADASAFQIDRVDRLNAPRRLLLSSSSSSSSKSKSKSSSSSSTSSSGKGFKKSSSSKDDKKKVKKTDYKKADEKKQSAPGNTKAACLVRPTTSDSLPEFRLN